MKRPLTPIRFRLLTVLLFVLPLSLVLAGNGPGDGSEVRIGISDSSVELNPLYAYVVTEAQLLTGLQEGLVSYHPLTLEPVPGVAYDWSVDDENVLYTFSLRSDARYSNGDRVSADHFRETWLTLLEMGEDAPYAGLYDIIAGARDFRRGENDDRDSVGLRAPDENTLEVELSQPAGHFLQMLAHHSFGVLHPDMLAQRDHNTPETHIGNGPFVLSQLSDERIIMERNEHYWSAAAVESSRIVFERFSDPQTATVRYLDGDIDWNAGNIAFDLVVDDRDLVANALFATTFYYIRAEVAPWNDDRVRRALALLLPWDEIRSDEVYFLPTHRLVPEIAGYPEVTGLTEQNVEEALELLIEAGFPEGEGLPAALIRIPGGFDANRVSTIMEEAWSRIDLTVEIETVSYPEYFDVAGEAEVTVGSFSWIGDYSDPLTFLQLWTSDSNLNEAGLNSVEYDDLIERAIPLEGSERFEVMAEAEQYLLSSGTILPVTHSAAFNLIQLNTVEGWFPNALDIHPLRYLRRAADEPAPGLIRY